MRTNRVIQMACVVVVVLQTVGLIGRDREQLKTYLRWEEVNEDRRNSPGVGLYILLAEPTTADELMDYLEDPNERTLKESAAIALSSIASVEPEVIDVDRILKYIDRLERQWTPGDRETIKKIKLGYWIAVSQGSDEAIRFMMRRTEPDFWKGRVMPEWTRQWSDSDPWIETAQMIAIVSFGLSHDEKIGSWLQELERRADVAADDALLKQVNTALQLFHASVSDYKHDMRYLELRRHGFRIDEEGHFVPIDEKTAHLRWTPPKPTGTAEGKRPDEATDEDGGGSGIGGWLVLGLALLLIGVSVVFIVRRIRA